MLRNDPEELRSQYLQCLQFKRSRRVRRPRCKCYQRDKSEQVLPDTGIVKQRNGIDGNVTVRVYSAVTANNSRLCVCVNVNPYGKENKINEQRVITSKELSCDRRF
jgi:hypothetical protein